MRIIKQIHTFTSNILFEQRHFGLGCPSLYQVKWPSDLIKGGATQTEMSLLKQYVAGERVDLLDSFCRIIFYRDRKICVQDVLRKTFTARPLIDRG